MGLDGANTARLWCISTGIGQVEEVAQACSEEIGLDDSLTRAHQHPNNIWALQGYYECLLRLGGRGREARIIRQQLDLAKPVDDVPVKSSCFCRFRVLISDDDVATESCCK